MASPTNRPYAYRSAAYSPAMSVATPNRMSVKPIRRSRITDSSTARARPKMLYSLVRAIASAGAGAVRVANGFRFVAGRTDEAVIGRGRGARWRVAVLHKTIG